MASLSTLSYSAPEAEPSSELPLIEAPTLLVLASKDRAVDNERTLKHFRKLPADQLRIHILDGQHAVQLEQPGDLGAIFMEWLQSQASRRSSVHAL